MNKRNELNKSISRAMYRFIQSHTIGFEGSITTLAKQLNMNENQPIYKIRAQIKSAIEELKSAEILDKQSGIKADRNYVRILKIKHNSQ